ncbi:MAG: hypothetical protein ACN4G0_14060 [Polyangiales bacterium]
MGKRFLVLLSFLVMASCVVEVQSVGPGRSLDGGVGGDGGSAGSGGTAGSGGLAGSGGTGGNVTGLECTVGTEDADCNGASCNPVTLECTEFRDWERRTCETCVSDANCWNSGHRCVPMFFDGERFPDDHTGFCLPEARRELPGAPYHCDGEEPYATVLYERVSMSGAESLAYCGVREDFTTCYAVLAQLAELECAEGSDDGCPAGGLCRYTNDNGKWDFRCTYACTSSSECRNTQGWELSCGGYCGS